jgi:hypothetical protein
MIIVAASSSSLIGGEKNAVDKILLVDDSTSYLQLQPRSVVRRRRIPVIYLSVSIVSRFILHAGKQNQCGACSLFCHPTSRL